MRASLKCAQTQTEKKELFIYKYSAVDLKLWKDMYVTDHVFFSLRKTLTTKIHLLIGINAEKMRTAINYTLRSLQCINERKQIIIDK